MQGGGYSAGVAVTSAQESHSPDLLSVMLTITGMWNMIAMTRSSMAPIGHSTMLYTSLFSYTLQHLFARVAASGVMPHMDSVSCLSSILFMCYYLLQLYSWQWICDVISHVNIA